MKKMISHLWNDSGNILEATILEGIYGKIPRPCFKREFLDLIKTGRVYSLSYIHSYPPKQPCGFGFILNLKRRHDLVDVELEGNTIFTESDETIIMSGHSITHLDGLCHIGEIENGKVVLYGNILAEEAEHFRGFKKLGIEGCPPIITRGVLLDIALYKDRDVLPESYYITARDLQGAAEHVGVEVKKGDCVLIRTGFSKIWQTDRRTFRQKPPGPGLGAAQWLVDKGVIISGSDTIPFERCPSPTHPVHRKLIKNNGLLITKLLNLEHLASDKVYEFLFIALPLRIFGATASPINPIAIC